MTETVYVLSIYLFVYLFTFWKQEQISQFVGDIRIKLQLCFYGAKEQKRLLEIILTISCGLVHKKTLFVKTQYVYWTVILKALWTSWTKRNMEKQPREIKPQPIKSIIIEMLHWASVILINLKRKDCNKLI